MSSSIRPLPFALAPVVASAVLALGGCGRPAAQAPAPPAPEVAVVTLAPQRVQLTRELPGRTAAFVIAEVRPQVTGIVQRRLFEEGDRVQAGQVLYQLDDATYRADLNSAKAALARAEAAAELARLNAERSAALAETDAVSRQANESAIATYRQAQAEVKAAEAAVVRSEIAVGYARVTSPIDGRIGKSTVTQGALVTANQAAPLTVVHQLDPIYVDVTQSSREWLELRRELAAGTLSASAAPVSVFLEDGSPYAQPGKLQFSDVAVDPTTGSIAVRVVVPNPENLLLPGMYVRAVIGTAVRENALLVPQPGVTRTPQGTAVAMVVGADGRVEVRPVDVRRTIGDQWLVQSGLAAGDKVIVQGLQKIRPGAPVRPVESSPNAPAASPARN